MKNDLTWAEVLVGKVLTYEGRLHPPRFKFYQSKNASSSGRTFIKPRNGYHIFVRLGTDIPTNKHVVLHELAHWLIGGQHGHDKKFWKKAWELFFLFQDELNLERVKVSEFRYKRKAIDVYEEYMETGFKPRTISFASSKPATVVKPPRVKEIKAKVNVREVRYKQAQEMVKKYKTKVKRDTNLLKKWQNKVKYYEKSL